MSIKSKFELGNIKNKLEDIVSNHTKISGVVTGGLSSITAMYFDAIYEGETFFHEVNETFSGDIQEVITHIAFPITVGILTSYIGKQIRSVRKRKETEEELRESEEKYRILSEESQLLAD